MGEETIQNIKSYISEVSAVMDQLPLREVAEVVRVIAELRQKGGKVFLFGNGGSAATASHFACDLAKGAASKGGIGIKAIALTDSIPTISAWANDTGYENIFAQQLENLIEPGDVAIAISGSGDSPNIINGVKVARARGATVIGFIGFDGGKLKDLVNLPIIVPGKLMEQVEDIHLLLGHVITVCLRGEE